jgi:hypothetical protein
MDTIMDNSGGGRHQNSGGGRHQGVTDGAKGRFPENGEVHPYFDRCNLGQLETNSRSAMPD